MGSIKTTHASSGSSDELIATKSAFYYADFTTGSGVGTAQLKMNQGGSWVPVCAPATGSMPSGQWISLHNRVRLRWDVTRVSGSIITYLEGE